MEDKKKISTGTSSQNRKTKNLNSSIDILADFIEYKINLLDLTKQVFDERIPLEFHSVMWKIFFNIISQGEFEKWTECIQLKRENYYKKCKELSTDEFIKYINSDKNNFKNRINEIYSKETLEYLNIIKLDIDRTFQEIDLFRNKEIKESLSRILYIWCVENLDIGYGQGMNEILGTIFYALYPSNSFRIDEKDKNIFSSYFYFLSSEEHFESDIYYIFSEIMTRGFKDLYNYNNIKFKETKQSLLVDGFEYIDKLNLSLDDIYSTKHSSLKKRINKIFYIYLKIADIELFLHLHDKVEPYLFLFRWILCILNREISLKNIIQVWNCIFAIECLDFNSRKNNKEIAYFNFLDFICVAMICNLKEELIQEDDSCYLLSMLMHFPNENNIKPILNSALKIRDLINDYLQTSKEYDMGD